MVERLEIIEGARREEGRREGEKSGFSTSTGYGYEDLFALPL